MLEFGPMSLVWINRLFVAVGIAFFGAAIFHGIAFFWPGISEPMPAATHAVFVGVNLFFGVAFGCRVTWLHWPFLVLTVQQVWSHGGDLVRALEEHPPRIDGQSVFALGGLGMIWVLLWVRQRATRAVG